MTLSYSRRRVALEEEQARLLQEQYENESVIDMILSYMAWRPSVIDWISRHIYQ